MTDLDDFCHALHAACRNRPGGIRALAKQLGKREHTLYTKLDPADDTHQPTVGEMIAILNALDDDEAAEVLEVFVGIMGYRLATRSDDRASGLMQATLHAVAEQGDVVSAVEQSMADGRITATERRRILRECAEARRALTVLENTLTASPADEEGAA